MKKLLFLLLLVAVNPLFAQKAKPKCLDGNCKNKIGTYLYSDSSIYVGSFTDKLRNGQGKITYKSGATYEGEWLNDKRHGKGVFVDSLKNRFEGAWLDDKENGVGKYTDTKGNVYEGTWTNGELKGYITLRYRNKNLYVGEYDKGLKGKGKFTYADGSIYTGNFNKNKRSGYGELVYHFGLTYKGNWVSNEIEGQGDFFETKSLKKLATGSWKTEKSDAGHLIYISDNGYMVCYYKNKDLYYGQVSKGLPNGNGMMIYSNGEVYEGKFVAGQFDGYGRYLYKDKSEYKGEWKNGLREGFGTLLKKDKTEEKGYWENNKYISLEKVSVLPKLTLNPATCKGNSEGDMEFDGFNYTGTCQNGLKQGTWKKVNSNGVVLEITNYKNGIKHGEHESFENDSYREFVSYENGLKEGPEITYNREGKIIRKAKYAKGVLIDTAYNYKDYNSDDGLYLHDVIIFEPWLLGNYPLCEINKDPWGERDGKVIEYYRNGSVKSIENLYDRERCGDYKEYDDKGILIADLEYESCEHVKLFDDERIISGWQIVANYETGKKEKRVYQNACLTEIYSGDKLIWKGLRCEDLQYGEHQYEYQENGKKLTQVIKLVDEGDGSLKIFGTRNFESGIIQSETLDGLTTHYHNGLIKSRTNNVFNFNVTYLESSNQERLRQGLIREFETHISGDNQDPAVALGFDDIPLVSYLLSLNIGEFRIEGDENQENSSYHFKKYFLRNQIIDSIYLKGHLINRWHFMSDGRLTFTSYFPNGNLKYSLNYIGSWLIHYDERNHLDYMKLDGPTEFYYDNGKPKLRAIFEDNSLKGTMTYYDQNGSKLELNPDEINKIKDEQLKSFILKRLNISH